ncbi:hypothetical protein, conserved [Entamoeba dispar SAW760]|uniref:Leucine rich repeat containing protein BspA family protein n=1 Tax=Entamoeba dispar (strain ATCC PRA-260 / SAW760) TaxID=370354 RepID=B0E8A2_ENTDS|nr:uncharacterized protein EDI_237920 [Entamoeba dispar SAW760]EDR29227.1 hypothetical protein, conserved [Entamoeba dispar SAW760]|eukprot:EDR29227.1 hypothetical protein, conserved [Entamoeba dispar SAW760]
MSKIDTYHMMIISKYFNFSSDFIDIVQICKKYKDIPSMFHYNPIPLTKELLKIFPNIQTQYIYSTSERRVEGIGKYYYFGDIKEKEYLSIKKKKEKNVSFRMVKMNESRLENNIKLPKEIKILLTCKRYHPMFHYYYYNNNYLDNEKINKIAELHLDSIMILGDNVFSQYKCLSKLELNNIRIIGNECINQLNSLKELNIQSLRYIGNHSICECTQLISITLPQTLYEEGTNCFQGLLSLKHISNYGITKINTSLPFEEARIFINNRIDVDDIYFRNTTEKNEIPNGVKRLEPNCFHEKEIEYIQLPISLTYLSTDSFHDILLLKEIDLRHVKKFEDDSFNNCPDLTSVTIMNKECFNCKMFCQCPNLKNIKFIDSPPRVIEDVIDNELAMALENQGIQCNTIQLRMHTSNQLREGIKIIYFEEENYEDTEVRFPLTLIEIHTNGMIIGNSWNNLTRLIFPPSLKKIGAGCFNNVSSLKELDLGNISEIGMYSFTNVSSLSSLTFSSNLRSLPSPIQFCSTIKRLIINGDKVSLPLCRRMATIARQMNICEINNIFLTKEESKELTEIPYDIDYLDSYCFSQRNDLLSITIPSNITGIGDGCFKECFNLTKVEINKSVKIIGDECFRYCKNLEKVDCYRNYSFGGRKFEGSKYLKSIEENTK